jgi:hypothetical protein
MTAEEKFEEVLGKLVSKDREVLEFCKAYLSELAAEENNRSRRAEDKAQVVLNTCGVGSTLLIAFAGLLFNRVSPSDIIVIIIPLICAVILISKSVYFCLRTLQPMQNNEGTPEFASEVQDKDIIATLRYDIAVRIWLYEANRQFHTSKVFYLHRAIRNFGTFVVTVVGTGLVMVLLLTRANRLLHSWWALVSGTLLLIFSVAFDRLAEKRGKLWF